MSKIFFFLDPKVNPFSILSLIHHSSILAILKGFSPLKNKQLLKYFGYGFYL